MSLRVYSSLVALLLALLSYPAWGGTAYVGGGGVASAPPKNNVITDEVFSVDEFLTGVETTGVIISMWPDAASDIRVNYGTSSSMGTRTTASAATGGVRHDITLSSLTAGTRYYYQIEAKDTNDAKFGVKGRNIFRTLRSAGGTYKFGIFSDSHAVTMWNSPDCGVTPASGWLLIEKSISNATNRGLDFLIDLGDTAMGSGIGAVECNVGAEDIGTSTVGEDDGDADRQAELRYQVVLMGEGNTSFGYQYMLNSLPFFQALGNHEGEMPNWGNATGLGACKQWTGHATHADTAPATEAGRLAMFPNPFDTYAADGEADGNYLTWASGDVRFIILDPYKFSPVVGSDGGGVGSPVDQDDWTLGATQKAWLTSTLNAATETWKIVIAHNLVGANDGGSCGWYARGGAKATDDGAITGTLLGEQAFVQGEMVTYGAQVFLSGHDHLAVAGEKLDSNGDGTGVHYIKAGTPSGQGAPTQNGFDTEEGYEYNAIVEASVGPDTIAAAAAAGDSTFTCTSCNFETAGFSANELLDVAGFSGGTDGIYSVKTVDSATKITVSDGQGNEDNIETDAGDGDETIQMRIPDYRESPARNGSNLPGFLEVTVNGTSSLVFKYIISDESDATVNNTVAFTYEITP